MDSREKSREIRAMFNAPKVQEGLAMLCTVGSSATSVMCGPLVIGGRYIEYVPLLMANEIEVERDVKESPDATKRMNDSKSSQ